NNRGEAYAILLALWLADGNRDLHIYSDSEYAIETIALRGPEKAALGWNIVNGDLFKDIALCIRQRRAPVQFIQVKGHS
ncbi:hypothetical protein BD779DRAFT_1392294, partial [Infundibulicybe gibba]